MDYGCDLVTVLHTKKRGYLKTCWAGTERPRTGVTRLRMAADRTLRYPVIAITSRDQALLRQPLRHRASTLDASSAARTC